MYVYSVLIGSYRCLAQVEREPTKKKEILLKGLQYRDLSIELTKKGQPFRYWNLSALHSEGAEIKRHLAIIETDHEKKLKLLLEANEEMEQCLELHGIYQRVHNLPGMEQQLCCHLRFVYVP
ncbi:hypothetical protein ES703_69511 [subsurface metagenome]